MLLDFAKCPPRDSESMQGLKRRGLLKQLRQPNRCGAPDAILTDVESGQGAILMRNHVAECDGADGGYLRRAHVQLAQGAAPAQDERQCLPSASQGPCTLRAMLPESKTARNIFATLDSCKGGP